MLIIRLIIAFLIFIAGTLLANRVVIAILRETISGKLEYSSKGYTISVLERFLIITIVLLGRYEAIGWIVAAKALARHEIKRESSFSAECFFNRHPFQFFLCSFVGSFD